MKSRLGSCRPQHHRSRRARRRRLGRV